VTCWGLKAETIQKIKQVFLKFPEIKEVRIFGSRALGNYKPGSDVDMALYGDAPLKCTTRISARLNQELPFPYHFDVVDYATVKRPEFLEHINNVSQLFYKK
jgi:uncharacterized protein